MHGVILADPTSALSISWGGEGGVVVLWYPKSLRRSRAIALFLAMRCFCAVVKTTWPEAFLFMFLIRGVASQGRRGCTVLIGDLS